LVKNKKKSITRNYQGTSIFICLFEKRNLRLHYLT
jgi:hypothetical protein